MGDCRFDMLGAAYADILLYNWNSNNRFLIIILANDFLRVLGISLTRI